MLGADGARIESNRTTGNGEAGIDLDFGNNGNLVRGNTATGNGTTGIEVGPNSTGNRLEGNTATGNTEFDLEDSNAAFPACPNTWRGNRFATDNEATAPGRAASARVGVNRHIGATNSGRRPDNMPGGRHPGPFCPGMPGPVRLHDLRGRGHGLRPASGHVRRHPFVWNLRGPSGAEPAELLVRGQHGAERLRGCRLPGWDRAGRSVRGALRVAWRDRRHSLLRRRSVRRLSAPWRHVSCRPALCWAAGGLVTTERQRGLQVRELSEGG